MIVVLETISKSSDGLVERSTCGIEFISYKNIY